MLIENVVRDPRVKFFGIPKLGAYLALPITYNSWLQPGGINWRLGRLSVLLGWASCAGKQLSLWRGSSHTCSVPKRPAAPRLWLSQGFKNKGIVKRERGWMRTVTCSSWDHASRWMTLGICALCLGRRENADLPSTDALEVKMLGDGLRGREIDFGHAHRYRAVSLGEYPEMISKFLLRSTVCRSCVRTCAI